MNFILLSPREGNGALTRIWNRDRSPGKSIPSNIEGDTLDFLVCSNTLIPLQQDYLDGTKHIKNAKNAIDDYHYGIKNCPVCNEN